MLSLARHIRHTPNKMRMHTAKATMVLANYNHGTTHIASCTLHYQTPCVHMCTKQAGNFKNSTCSCQHSQVQYTNYIVALVSVSAAAAAAASDLLLQLQSSSRLLHVRTCTMLQQCRCLVVPVSCSQDIMLFGCTTTVCHTHAIST